MTRAFAGLSFVALFPGALFSQSTDAPPSFELTDVHLSAPSTRPVMRGGVVRGGRYDLRNATMLDLIETAYGIDSEKVVGGPSWLESDRFDVIAKMPPDTSPEAAKLMLQALLKDRFQLTVHTESRSMPVYVLSVDKGKRKLKESDGSETAGCQGQPQKAAPGTIPYAMVQCRNMTMAAFAENLRRIGADYFTHPVVDSTGLTGSWDFDMKWTGRLLLSLAGADGITIFEAVEKQLGLKLELQRLPTPVLVVDNVNRKPSANPPGVTETLPPPPPAEFEVAEIKPSMPGAIRMARMQNGRLDIHAFSLNGLITYAWGINGDELLAGAPKWLDSGRFDVVAKASSSGASRQVDPDTIRLMLRALLADRFKLVTHTENRPVNAYTLVAAKPKLKKADPSSRAGCTGEPATQAVDRTNPIFSILITCQNMTLAEFAAQLQGLAPSNLHTSVLDATAIEGAWDFSFSFTPLAMLQASGGRGGGGIQAADSANAASDPNGALSLFEAINKQLGLKLVMQKRSAPVLVIDHAEEMPTEN